MIGKPADNPPLRAANQRKIEYLMSGDRDFAGSTSPRFRYLLCSVPRSGSSLMSQMLTDTGMAGDPLEYLNPAYIRANLKQHPVTQGMQIPILKYLEGIEQRRTSSNGVFGLKIHYSHFSKFWKVGSAESLDFIRKFNKIIFINRRDRLAQAVSYFRAQHTGSWSSLTENFADGAKSRVTEPDYDATALGEILAYLLGQEHGWRNFFRTSQIPHTEIVYEDYIADYANQSRQLLDELEIDSKHQPIPAPSLTRQSRLSCSLTRQFKRDLGLDESREASHDD